MDPIAVVATWLHTVAFVIAWGYYGVLGRIVLPGLEVSLDRGPVAATVAAIERRALPLVVLSMVLFGLTGTYLLVSDPKYAGLGAFFATTWTTLMLVKHVVVVALVTAAVLVDQSVRRLANAATDEERVSAMRGVRLSAEAATGLGALIALLTAAAQLAA
jgi:uncharacterized membrane protein